MIANVFGSNVQPVVEPKNSTHRADVFRVSSIKPHGNADRLEIIEVDGYRTIIQKNSFKLGDLAVFIPPDNLVDIKRDCFAFLAPRARADGKCRIKAMKLRGELSFGLIVPAPEGLSEGDNAAEVLGIEHYDPDVHRMSGGSRVFTGGEDCPGPNLMFVKYDLESGRKYGKQVFEEGEPVWILEKAHGANSRYVFHDGKFFCGSRTNWKKEYPDYSKITRESLLAQEVSEERADEILARLKEKAERNEKNTWWKVLDICPGLKTFLENNPDVIVYGEVYGAVQDLNYGVPPGEVRFAAFDMMKDGKWFDYEYFLSACEAYDIPVSHLFNEKVPQTWGVYKHIYYNFEEICKLAEGESLMAAKNGAKHVREGVVVRSWTERSNPCRGVGRAVLKWVGCGYLERE